MRETFFFNQINSIHQVISAKCGDFIVDETYVFEIVGKTKTYEQSKCVSNAYLALDIKNGN